MTPRHKTVLIPVPDDCSADGVVAKANSPPEWRDTLKWMPLIGNSFNTLFQAGHYNTSMEDPLDFIAADLAKGLQSEFVNKRISFKMKMKVQST